MTNKPIIRKGNRSREQNGGRLEQGGAALEGLVARRGTADYLGKCGPLDASSLGGPVGAGVIDITGLVLILYGDLEIAGRMRFSHRQRTRKTILMGFL